jgi:hypothetical protein
MAAMNAGRTVSYNRVAACVQRGLLERFDMLRSEPRLLRATRAGLRYAQLGGLPVAVVSAGSADHWLRCASTAQLLGEEFDPTQILSERELVLAEQIEGRPLASAKVGELLDGSPQLHRPDLVIMPAAGGGYGGAAATLAGTSDAVADRIAQGGQGVGASAASSGCEAEQLPIAVEVELTAKAPRRLKGVIRGWRRASWVAEVRYYCAPGPTRRAVERAVTELRAQERIRILEVVAR